MKPQTIILKYPGETIMGELVSRTENTVKVRNPANLFLQPTQNGQLSVQMFPVFFKELINSKVRERGTIWEYSLVGAGIAEDIEFDDQLNEHYARTFNPSPIITPHGSGKVLTVFDDK